MEDNLKAMLKALEEKAASAEEQLGIHNDEYGNGYYDGLEQALRLVRKMLK